ncbi:hypothetical protein N7507_005849 [Penicillium longicatenatum]|nr:hypothetical protein N7507_005849 [Penicillium longicatenatum]
MNNRSVSEDTEQDVALTLSAYWPLALRGKLEKVIKDKVSRRRRVQLDNTSIIVSVNDRKRWDLKKRFSYLNIDWITVEKQLLDGKELRLVIIFNHIEDDRFPISTAGKNEKRGRSSLRTYRLKRLIIYIERGGILECQDNIPDAIREELFLENQQRLENSQSKSSKQHAPGNWAPININFMGAQPCL